VQNRNDTCVSVQSHLRRVQDKTHDVKNGLNKCDIAEYFLITLIKCNQSNQFILHIHYANLQGFVT